MYANYGTETRKVITIEMKYLMKLFHPDQSAFQQNDKSFPALRGGYVSFFKKIFTIRFIFY